MNGGVPVASTFLFQVVGEQYIELLTLRLKVADLEAQLKAAQTQNESTPAYQVIGDVELPPAEAAAAERQMASVDSLRSALLKKSRRTGGLA